MDKSCGSRFSLHNDEIGHMHNAIKTVVIAVLVCTGLILGASGCGAASSNGLMEGASAQTSAMALYIYDGETVTRMHAFEDQQDILDRLDTVKAVKATDWSLADIALPVFGLEIGTTDGLGICASWSNGYWITQEGDAYLFDFDFAALEQDYSWSGYDTFADFSVFPCAHILTQDENGWNSALLTPAGESNPPDGITMRLDRWTGDAVTVLITNESGAEWGYGEYFSLQVQLDGVWYRIPPVSGNWGFHDIGLMIQDGETQEKTYRLTMYGELPPATYRLVAYDLTVESDVV